MSRIRRRLAVAVTSLAALAVPATAGAVIVNNGDFETGNLSGWQTFNSSPPSGDWFAYTGTTSPTNGFPVTAPPQGRFAAITDQGDLGLHILYQDIVVPPGGSQDLLSLVVYYRSAAPVNSRSTLDPNALGANQQYRVDVVRPGARIDSMSGILSTAFATANGDPMTLAPTQVKTFIPIAFAGKTVRLRLAEVDNQDFFNASADAVFVSSNAFTIGKARLNKKKGIARLPVTVQGPGTLAVSGKGIKANLAAKTLQVTGGTVNLRIKPTGKTALKLSDTGKAKVKVSVTYTPTGLNPNTQKKKLKLKKS